MFKKTFNRSLLVKMLLLVSLATTFLLMFSFEEVSSWSGSRIHPGSVTLRGLQPPSTFLTPPGGHSPTAIPFSDSSLARSSFGYHELSSAVDVQAPFKYEMQKHRNHYHQNSFRPSSSLTKSSIPIKRSNSIPLTNHGKTSDLKLQGMPFRGSTDHAPIRRSDSSIPVKITPDRPKNISRFESPHYPWGNHEFGPVENYFFVKEGTRWRAFFNHEAIAVVLEDNISHHVLNCTLLEIIPLHEQEVALQTLGKVMALVPLTLEQMIKLNSFCSTSHELLPLPVSTTPKTVFSTNTKKPDELLRQASSVLFGILPGTRWCGLSDRARTFHNLGARREIDRCCRAHDHCPVKLRAGSSRYGATNFGFSTVSHCSCDREFLHCLKAASEYDEVADIVGNIFFNLVQPDCLDMPPITKPESMESKTRNLKEERKTRLKPIEQETRLEVQPADASSQYRCLLSNDGGNCHLWQRRPDAVDLQLQIIQPDFKYRR